MRLSFLITTCLLLGEFQLEVRLANDNNGLSNARNLSWTAPIRILIWMNAVK